MTHKLKIKFRQRRKSAINIPRKPLFSNTTDNLPYPKQSLSSFRIQTESSITNKNTLPEKKFLHPTKNFQTPSKISFLILDERSKLKRKQNSCPLDVKKNILRPRGNSL